MGKSLEWLKEQVDQVVFDDKLFRVYVSDDKYIFGAHLANDKGPNYFSLSTIYDSIVMLKRATEVYIKVSEFIKEILDEIKEYFSNNNIFGDR